MQDLSSANRTAASIAQKASERFELVLSHVETWITHPVTGEKGWGKVKPCLLVRLTTAEGVSGWGEAFVLQCRETAVAQIIHELSKRVAAQGVTSPALFRKTARQVVSKHYGLDVAAATSAIEMALWDICGKLVSKPLCSIFGATGTPAPIPVYGNVWSETQWHSSALVARASQLVSQGYKAIKLHPTLNHSTDEAARAVLEVRSAVGDDIELLVDLNSHDDPSVAPEICRQISLARLYWLEEPVDGVNMAELASIRHKTGQRIVTGEKSCGVLHFRNILEAQCADILNPDIAGIGGLLDFLEVAALADLRGVMISPHCWNSMTVAAAAMLHVCTAIANPEMAEIFPESVEHGQAYADLGFQLNGSHAVLADKPGLGVHIDADKLNLLSGHYKSTKLSVAMASPKI